MKARLVLMHFSLGLLMAGCTSGFTTQDPVSDAAVATAASLAPQGKVASSKGELSWTRQKDQSQDVHFSYDLKIPFGRVYKELSKMTRWAAPSTCQWVDGAHLSPMKDYVPGEIPCGTIVNNDWKDLFDIQLSSTTGKAGGWNYQINGATLPIWMSRGTRQGNYTEQSLDTKSSVTRASSKIFAEDVSLRYVPNKTSSRMEVCMNVPGVILTSTSQEIYAHAWQPVLWFNWDVGTNLLVTPGYATYDYGRACFAADFVWRAGVSDPQVTVSATQAPSLVNMNYSGLNVQIENWFLSFLDQIMDFFHSSFRKSLIAQATQTANQYADSDLETGAWFSKIQGQALLTQVSRKLSDLFRQSLTRIGIPSSEGDLRERLQDACRLQKFSSQSTWNSRMRQFCESVLDKAVIEVDPFQVDADSKAAGCYDSFARIHDTVDASGNAKWWATQCQFAAHFSITLPGGWADYQSELQTLLEGLVSEDQIPPEWLPVLKSMGVDNYVMALVLEEAEKEGISQVQSGDWQANLADIVQQVRSGLLSGH